MKICMLAESLPPAFGGAARQAMALAAELQRQGSPIFFASAQIVPGSPCIDTVQGFTVYRVPHIYSGKWIKFKKLAGYCALLWRQRQEYDILHVHGPYYLALGAVFFAQKVVGKKVVLKLTSLNFDTPSAVKAGCYPKLSWFFYRRADAFVCISTAQWNECLAHGLPESRLHRIPNGVDARRFCPAHSTSEQRELRQQLGLDPERAYGLFIGSIEENKGIRLLVEAAIKVCAIHDKVDFLLLGPDGRHSGEAHISAGFVEQIRNRIRSAGLEHRIQLLGRKDNPAEYLRAASFFVFPSRSEGFGTVLIEAMATGLPTVTLNIPGVTTDIITHNHDGIIIEREDPEAFAEAVLKLLSEPEYAQALGAAARSTVQVKFDFSAVAQKYAELYHRLLATEATDDGK